METINECISSSLTGRKEFVQRLKLEATLNVHDGCVSASLLRYLFIYRCIFGLSVSADVLLQNTPSRHLSSISHCASLSVKSWIEHRVEQQPEPEAKVVDTSEKPEADIWSQALSRNYPGNHSLHTLATAWKSQSRFSYQFRLSQ